MNWTIVTSESKKHWKMRITIKLSTNQKISCSQHTANETYFLTKLLHHRWGFNKNLVQTWGLKMTILGGNIYRTHLHWRLNWNANISWRKFVDGVCTFTTYIYLKYIIIMTIINYVIAIKSIPRLYQLPKCWSDSWYHMGNMQIEAKENNVKKLMEGIPEAPLG